MSVAQSVALVYPPLIVVGTVSTDDVERLLEFQVDSMQSTCCSSDMFSWYRYFHRDGHPNTGRYASPTPANAEHQRDCSRTHPLCRVSRVPIMSVKVGMMPDHDRFLNSWRCGDYPGSFDNLHRYFDYTMQNRDR